MLKRILLTSALAALCLPFATAADGPAAKPVAGSQHAKDEKGQEPKHDPKKEEKKDDKPAAELGKPAPEFALKDLDGKEIKLSDYKGKIVVLEWVNPQCPFCVAAYSETGPLRELPERMKKEGVVWLAINSGSGESGAVELNKNFLKDNKSTVTCLLDPSGATGRAYGAKTTPHCYVIDEKGVLRYRGALDNAPGGKVADKETKTNYVQKAIEELKAGKAVTIADTKSYGCTVKYAKP